MRKRYTYKIQIILISCIFIFCGGCSHKEKQDNVNEVHKNFDSNIESIINGEYGDNFHYISLNGQIKDSLSKGSISSAIANKITFEYKDAKIENDYAVVTADFIYPDIMKITNEIMETDSDISDNEFSDILLLRLNNGEYSAISCTAEIPYIKLDDEWYMLECEEFSNIITGGVYSEYIKAEEEAYNNLKEMEDVLNENNNE